MLGRTNINTEVARCRETEGAVLVDVRSREEYEQGHIPGSIHLDAQELYMADEVLPDLDAPVFLYCLTGARSGRAAAALVEMGYENAVSIGGINAWRGELATGRD